MVATSTPSKATKVERSADTKPARAPKAKLPLRAGPRWGVIITLAVLLAVLALVLLNK